MRSSRQLPLMVGAASEAVAGAEGNVVQQASWLN